jgi:hypothetical protein
MHADPHTGPLANLRLDLADRAETRWMKQASRAKQERIEQLGRTRNSREEF